MIFKNNFDPKKTSFQLFAHPHKKSPNFQFITFNNLRKRVIVIPYIRKEYQSPKIYSQVRANQVQIHHLRIFHETSRVRPFSNAPGESRINNRQWNVNDRHVSTTAVPTLWTEGGEGRGGRGRVCLDLGLREDLPVTSTREFRAKYLFIRLWYA